MSQSPKMAVLSFLTGGMYSFMSESLLGFGAMRMIYIIKWAWVAGFIRTGFGEWSFRTRWPNIQNPGNLIIFT
jgi:hypothetical protein